MRPLRGTKVKNVLILHIVAMGGGNEVSVPEGWAGSHARTVAEDRRTWTCFPSGSRPETPGLRRNPQSPSGLAQGLGKPEQHRTGWWVDVHMPRQSSRSLRWMMAFSWPDTVSITFLPSTNTPYINYTCGFEGEGNEAITDAKVCLNADLNYRFCRYYEQFQVSWFTLTSCHRASWPVKASGRLIPLSAIQSISLSHLVQSHHTEE